MKQKTVCLASSNIKKQFLTQASENTIQTWYYRLSFSLYMDVKEKIKYSLSLKPFFMHTMATGTSYILQHLSIHKSKLQSTFIWISILGKMSLHFNYLTWLEGKSSYFMFYILICCENYIFSEINCDVNLMSYQLVYW